MRVSHNQIINLKKFNALFCFLINMQLKETHAPNSCVIVAPSKNYHTFYEEIQYTTKTTYKHLPDAVSYHAIGSERQTALQKG